MTGRKPKPTGLHLVTDTINVTRHADRGSGPKPQGEVRKPAFVKGVAGRLWNEKAPGLIAAGVLTSWDVEMFGAWCCLMAEFQKAPDRFNSARMTQMRALGAAFGLMPAERARLKTPGQKESTDPAARYFKRPGS